jgi:HEAT repeat protein
MVMLERRRQVLQEALRDKDEEVRVAASEALERLEAVQSLDDILQVLRGGNRGQQVRAIFALEKIHSPRVFPPLLAALRVADADLRCAAIQVLGEKRHVKALEFLVRHLKDPHPAVRVHAATALGNFCDRRLVPCLSAVLADEDEELVVAALESLARIGFAEAEGAVLRLTDDSRTRVRCTAMKVLGCLGVAAPVTAEG